jgi:hypothetical protein
VLCRREENAARKGNFWSTDLKFYKEDQISRKENRGGRRGKGNEKKGRREKGKEMKGTRLTGGKKGKTRKG